MNILNVPRDSQHLEDPAATSANPPADAMSWSKGVDYYGYINNAGLSDTVSIMFSGPKVGSTLTDENNYQQNNLQIDSSNISGWDNFDAPYTWIAASG